MNSFDTSADIAFLHIGKNAGTQIAYICKQLEILNYKIVQCSHDTKLKHLNKGVRYFFSIRNPIDRFPSGFYSRKRKGLPRIYVEWTECEAIAFQKFSHANDLAESLFRTDYIGTDARAAIKSIRHTGMQQDDWFEGFAFLNQRPPIHIIRQEHLAQDMNLFLELLGCKIDVTELISPDIKVSHKNEYKDTPNLSNTAINNLKKWYVQDDFFYEACCDWIKGKF